MFVEPSDDEQIIERVAADSTYLATKYRPIAARRGPKKALVATP